MSTTVDTLITKYVLDDQFSAKAGKIADSVVSGVKDIGKYAALAGGTVFALGVKASMTAARFEVLEQSLITVTGSAQRAKEVFDFVQAQAAPSAFFGVAELGEAAKLLESFRLKVEDFLPAANTMASIFGQNAESLNSFVMALGRIRSGNFGEGFERLREMGISREMLEKQGLQFSSGNQFKGTSQQALTAVRMAVQTEFGGLDEAMKGTFQAQLATAGDLVEQAFAKLGGGLNDGTMPLLQTFNTRLQELVDSGHLERFGQMLADSIPGIIENFRSIGDALMRFGVAINDLFIAENPWEAWTAAVTGNLNQYIDKQLGLNQPEFNDENLTPEQRKFMEDYRERMAEQERRNNPAKGIPLPPNQKEKEVVDIQRTNTVFLGEIAKNTRETVNLQRIALGAGAGSLGITPVELSEGSRSRGAGRIGKAVELLVSAVQAEMIQAASDQSASRRQAFGRG